MCLCSTLPLYSMTEDNSASILREAEDQFTTILETHWKSIDDKLLEVSSFYRYHRSFSSGMQEYIEAYGFWYFLKTGHLCDQRLLEQGFRKANLIHLQVTLEDYVGGIADMSGEIMRRANSICSPAHLQEVLKMGEFLRQLEDGPGEVCRHFTSLKQKWRMIQENVRKVENTCYLWKLREFDTPYSSGGSRQLQGRRGFETSRSQEIVEKEEEDTDPIHMS
jgi:predicted translin family RNA/ssDNA-binding protein